MNGIFIRIKTSIIGLFNKKISCLDFKSFYWKNRALTKCLFSPIFGNNSVCCKSYPNFCFGKFKFYKICSRNDFKIMKASAKLEKILNSRFIRQMHFFSLRQFKILWLILTKIVFFFSILSISLKIYTYGSCFCFE